MTTVKVVLFQSKEIFGVDGDMPWTTLEGAIKFLEEKLAAIPPEFRSNATFEIEGEDDGYGAVWASFEIAYSRPETEQERLARDEKRKRIEALRNAREREEFERLKLKFGRR